MNKRCKLSMLICLIISVSILSGCNQNTVAETKPTSSEQIIQENQIPVIGKVYTFAKDNNYLFSSSSEYTTSDLGETYGSFSIIGTESPIVENDENDGVPAYSVSGGNIMISYSYDDEILSATDDEWHLVDDSGTTIDVTKLDKSIQKGTIVLQKSMDHMNWYNISVQTNVFKDTPIQNGVLYKTTDIEMINGCYYRLMGVIS